MSSKHSRNRQLSRIHRSPKTTIFISKTSLLLGKKKNRASGATREAFLVFLSQAGKPAIAKLSSKETKI